MKKISFNAIQKWFKNKKNNILKATFYYKDVDEYIMIEPIFDNENNIDDFYNENDSYLKEDMPLSKLLNLDFYYEITNG